MTQTTHPTRLERHTTAAGAEVAVLTVAHGTLNLFDRALFDAVIADVAALGAAPPRAVLIRAEGKVVSGGVDVHLFEGLDAGQGARLWQDLFARIIHPLEALPCPVVFAAHGLTLTAAFEISLACDIVLAAPGAKFGLVETVVGLTPSMGGPQRLAERAGSGRARELVMTGDLYDARRCGRGEWSTRCTTTSTPRRAPSRTGSPTVPPAPTTPPSASSARGGPVASPTPTRRPRRFPVRCSAPTT